MISYHVSPDDDWAIGPHTGKDRIALASEQRSRSRKINNAYRLSHKLLNSRAELVRGTAFAIPTLVGPVDITTFVNMLQQVGNPLLALRQAARITTGNDCRHRNGGTRPGHKLSTACLAGWVQRPYARFIAGSGYWGQPDFLNRWHPLVIRKEPGIS